MIAPHVPLLLALLATGLLALAIFAPERPGRPPTVSFAPPPPVSFAPPPAPVEPWSAQGRFEPPPADWFEPVPHPFEPAPADDREHAGESPRERSRPQAEPGWPSLVDPSAAGCDAAARLALVDALATVRAPWAEAILERAHADEPDPLVRAAVGAALGTG